MRSLVFAATTALTFGLLGTQNAGASAWQDQMLGIPRVSSAANRMWELRTGARRNANRERQRVASLTNDDFDQEDYDRESQDEDTANVEEAPAPRARRSRRRTNRVHRRQSHRRARRHYSRGSVSGVASYYWQPQRVASGGWFNPNALTAAHKTLPFGTRVRVTNVRNGRSVVVRINDRGPYVRGRVIDLSRRAAGVVGMRGSGTAPVRIQVLGRD
jgi:peptidoglycan lytic transglycosylase